MSIMITFFFLSLLVFVLIKTQQLWLQTEARRKGLYPLDGEVTLFDIRKMIMHNERDLAIRFYCHLYKTSTRKARIEVEAIAQSIRQKNTKQDLP